MNSYWTTQDWRTENRMKQYMSQSTWNLLSRNNLFRRKNRSPPTNKKLFFVWKWLFPKRKLQMVWELQCFEPYWFLQSWVDHYNSKVLCFAIRIPRMTGSHNGVSTSHYYFGLLKRFATPYPNMWCAVKKNSSHLKMLQWNEFTIDKSKWPWTVTHSSWTGSKSTAYDPSALWCNACSVSCYCSSKLTPTRVAEKEASMAAKWLQLFGACLATRVGHQPGVVWWVHLLFAEAAVLG